MNNWREKIKRPLRRLTVGLPLSLIKRSFSGVPIGFFYHIISDAYVPHVSNIFSYRGINKFEEDVVFLKRNFDLLSYGELVAHLIDKKPFPKRPAFVSFDDGLREVFDYARPVLKKHNIPCVFFLTTDFLDNKEMFFRHKASLCLDRLKNCSQKTLVEVFNIIKQRISVTVKSKDKAKAILRGCDFGHPTVIDAIGRALGIDFADYLRSVKPYMTSDEIKVMLSEGFEIGSHGRNHNPLDRVPHKELAREIYESSLFLDKRFGVDKVGFSFPFSAKGIDLDWLKNIQSVNRSIGLFFGSDGIGLQKGPLIDRISCDFSSVRDAQETSMGSILKLYSMKYYLSGRAKQ